MADATRPRNLWEPLISERAKDLIKKLETFMRDEVSDLIFNSARTSTVSANASAKVDGSAQCLVKKLSLHAKLTRSLPFPPSPLPSLSLSICIM